MRFLRQVEVIVGDDRNAILVRDLFVKFRIRRESTVTPAEGEVAIYNLIESNERQIHDRARRVQLRVGYGSRSRPVDLSLIFDGDIRRVTRERDKLDRITRIHVGGFLARRVPAIFNHTYSRSVPVREIVADALETYNVRSEDDPPLPELTFGPLDAIPESATQTDYRAAGNTTDVLRELLAPLGVRMYENNGQIRFTRSGARTAGARTWEISEQTGMIETPTLTDDGLRVRTLLDPRVQLDDLVDVRALATEGAGPHKVVVLTHEGDNRRESFYTEIEGRPVA